jgi:hypothetical protein
MRTFRSKQRFFFSTVKTERVAILADKAGLFFIFYAAFKADVMVFITGFFFCVFRA